MDYIFTRLKQELFVHSIISIHYYEYTSEFRYPGEAHDFWELILCDSGELLINAGDKEMILSKGQAYLHPPMQYHNVHAEGGRSANSVILSFESDTPELWNVCDKIINTDSYITTALFSILREAKVSCKLPIVTKPSESLLNEEAERQKSLADRADAVFQLTKPKGTDGSFAMRTSPFFKG